MIIKLYGGPAHDKVMEIPDTYREIYISVPARPVYKMSADDPTTFDVAVETVIYRRFHIVAAGQDRALWTTSKELAEEWLDKYKAIMNYTEAWGV